MSVTGKREQQDAKPPMRAFETETPRGDNGIDSTNIASLVMDAARLTSRARSGAPLDTEEIQRFASNAMPVVSAGLAEVGRLARKHKPTPAQRDAAKAATVRAAVAGRNRAAALLEGARAPGATSADEGRASASKGALSSRAWLYKRLIFSQARAGTLSLRNGRVRFVTDEMDSVISVPLSQVRNASFNWLTMSMTASFGTQRWMVSFTGPGSGGSIKDARRVIVAIREIKSWQKALRGDEQTESAETSPLAKKAATKTPNKAPRRTPTKTAAVSPANKAGTRSAKKAPGTTPTKTETTSRTTAARNATRSVSEKNRATGPRKIGSAPGGPRRSKAPPADGEGHITPPSPEHNLTGPNTRKDAQ